MGTRRLVRRPSLEALVQRVDAQRPGEITGDTVPTGFASVDKLLGGGFRRRDLVVLGGDVGAGKSALALGIALRVEPGSPAICRGDRDRVVQIIGNYLSNALRYAPTRSTVTLSVAGRGDEVVVTVRDEGPGLPGDQLAHLFDRFYRADPSRSRALGGSGIGLAIVRALAEAMGGRAWAESSGPGSGSAFHVALPAA